MNNLPGERLKAIQRNALLFSIVMLGAPIAIQPVIADSPGAILNFENMQSESTSEPEEEPSPEPIIEEDPDC